MTATSEATVADGLGSALVSYPADIASSLADSTKKVHGKLMGNIEWYFEHWVDIYEEIKAENQDKLGSFSLADVMGALPNAKVASDIAGRVRLRVPLLKGQDALCAQCADMLGAVPGIDQVHVSPITGSVLAFYDTGEFSSLSDLLESLRG
ncbi:MAG: hypothetical protein KDI07_12825 [Anaerolineae bacterium]|nr:hypothetical protein [Anaerolineae bacterium]HRX02366.1 hypothetical protein [Anaerolineae bacterium]